MPARVYEDRGWDVTGDVNRRLDDRSDRAAAFPTLSDLVAKVDAVQHASATRSSVTADIRAALKTRLNSLRTGGKGRMLDCRRSYPTAELLRHPTVLELEGMGDDDDKSFVMALLMVRLAEHLRAEGDLSDLRHLLVIEEAHRLLANPGVAPGRRVSPTCAARPSRRSPTCCPRFGLMARASWSSSRYRRSLRPMS